MRDAEANRNDRLPVLGAWLVDATSGRRHAIAGALTTIGRAGHVALATDPYCSRRHASILARGGEWWFCDLESANGSFINARPAVRPQLLRHGDLIVVGNTTLRFEHPAGARLEHCS